jgi:hypothetical protein
MVWTPVRGTTRPSIPPSLHRCEEASPKVESRRPWIFFPPYVNVCETDVFKGVSQQSSIYTISSPLSYPVDFPRST